MKENSIMRTTVSPSWRHTAFEPAIQSRPAARKFKAADADLHNLKTKLLRPILEETREPDLCHRLRLAANEALADAMKRPSPFLVLPYLFESKVREVQQWFARQQQIRTMTRRLFQTWSDGVEECWNFGKRTMTPSLDYSGSRGF